MFNYNNMSTKLAVQILEIVSGYEDQKFTVVGLYDIEYDRYEQNTTYEYKIVFEDNNEGGWFRTSLFMTVDKDGTCVSADYSGCPDHELEYPDKQDAIRGCKSVNFEQ